jgi:hypothetical protein
MNNIILIKDTINTLKRFVHVLEQLSYDEYTEKHSILSNSSIGEHTRHTIELFHQMLEGYIGGKINYDNRKRDLKLQEDIEFAMDSLAGLVEGIKLEDKCLYLLGLHVGETPIQSTYFRELFYNLEHCIHHQAIIKIALLKIGKENVSEAFGVAKSTIQYRKECAH